MGTFPHRIIFVFGLCSFVLPLVTLAALPTSPYYLVTNVVDGDTIDVKIGSKIERLRLVGMDTPETVDPRKPVQCFGKEASARTKKLLLGKKVQLVADSTQGDRDKYGRLLRYVILDGLNFNKRLIAEGYAHESTYIVPYKYRAVFKQAQNKARADKKGLWSPTTCPIQAAINPTVKKSGSGLCHVKGSAYYNQTKKFAAYATIKACIVSGGKLPK